jgi:hypothetical protein
VGSQVLRVAWYRVLATARRRLAGYLGLAVVIGLVLLPVCTLILVNLVAALPGWTAARTPAALALRAE